MDFSLTEDQQALQQLTRRILADHVDHERLEQLEAGADGMDHETWARLADVGVLGISLPAAHDGGGLGFLESALVLEEIGRATAPLPYLWTVVGGALPIAAFGDDGQRATLARVATGAAQLTVGLDELANDDPNEPATRAVPDDGGWRLEGRKHFVPRAAQAEAVLVPARAPEGVAMFTLDPHSAGVELEENHATNGLAVHTVALDGARAGLLGSVEEGSAIVEWTRLRVTAGLCAIQAGVCERALRMTAEYTSGREQFDHPIASFQAVSQRAADAYIDTEAVRLTARQAAWRISRGLSATDPVATAKFWAGEGASRVVHAAQHLHGGIGVDTDYPLHRCFTWARWIELQLGSSTQQLRRLGATLASG